MIVLLPTIGFAQLQSSHRPTLCIGVKADLQSAGIANQNNFGQNEMDYGINIGFGGGAVVTYQLNPKYALLLEATYQTAGQNYDDTFKGKRFMKDVEYGLISVPIALRYQLTEPVGYSGVGTESKPIWYLLAGLQFDKFLSPEIDWNIDGVETEFLEFVLEGGNPNQSIIESLGQPSSDEEFFTTWDLAFVAAGGFQLYMTPALHFTIEVRGGLGVTDINAEPWRLNNNHGTYGASRNSFLGLHAGIHLQLTQP